MEQSVKCGKCGCSCKGKSDQGALHLHLEIENLKQKLLERENHIVKMETNFLNEVDKYPNGECAALAEELLTWQDKYSRLYEAHKRVQKVNQNLEDKLLKIVDKCETEKNILTKDIVHLEEKLAEANANMGWLKEENERNKNDVNLAIQLLQCKPSNFVPQKFESLPVDLQQKVKLYMSNKKKPGEANGQNKHEMKTIKVPIPTFPPTAMFYSINKSTAEKDNEEHKSGKSVDIVSAAIMAKILEEREKERQNIKHCASCICSSQRLFTDQSCQTENDISCSHCFLEKSQSTIHNSLISNSKNTELHVKNYQNQSLAVCGTELRENANIFCDEDSSIITSGNSNSNNKNNCDIYVVKDSTRYCAFLGHKKHDILKLNTGESQNHLSKMIRNNDDFSSPARGLVEEKETALSGEIFLEKSVKLRDSKAINFTRDICLEEKIDKEKNQIKATRKCSINSQSNSSNILLDSVTSFSPTGNQQAHPYALVHKSKSISESSSINDECSDLRPTETQI